MRRDIGRQSRIILGDGRDGHLYESLVPFLAYWTWLSCPQQRPLTSCKERERERQGERIFSVDRKGRLRFTAPDAPLNFNAPHFERFLEADVARRKCGWLDEWPTRIPVVRREINAITFLGRYAVSLSLSLSLPPSLSLCVAG